MKKNKIVCIVDDEEINQFILKTLIKNLNKEIEIIAYNNGEEALASLTQTQTSEGKMPDILLLDINMPVMGGWQFLDEFIKIKPKIAKNMEIYIISSSTAPDDKKKAKTYSEILGYLSRPIEAHTLKEIIEKNG